MVQLTERSNCFATLLNGNFPFWLRCLSSGHRSAHIHLDSFAEFMTSFGAKDLLHTNTVYLRACLAPMTFRKLYFRLVNHRHRLHPQRSVSNGFNVGHDVSHREWKSLASSDGQFDAVLLSITSHSACLSLSFAHFRTFAWTIHFKCLARRAQIDVKAVGIVIICLRRCVCSITFSYRNMHFKLRRSACGQLIHTQHTPILMHACNVSTDGERPPVSAPTRNIMIAFRRGVRA